MIRIVGLSATLPNYVDVAHFLRVNPMVRARSAGLAVLAPCTRGAKSLLAVPSL